MPRNSIALVLLALTACDGMSVGNRTQRTGEVTMTGGGEVTTGANSVTPEGVGAPMAWRVEQGAAFYGAANQPPAFALRCERAANAITFERAGGGTSMILSVGGVGATLGTRAVANGRVQARTGMGDAVLDAMARPQAQIAIGGGAETLTIPGGVAVRRVVDYCRNPPAPVPSEPPADNAVAPIEATTPGPSATPESAPAATPQAAPRPAGNRDTAGRPNGPAIR